MTTKQLRENMPQVIRDLNLGKSVQLTYRHKLIGTLQPAQLATHFRRRGSAGAVQSFLKTADFGPIPSQLKSSSTSFKREMADLRSQT